MSIAIFCAKLAITKRDKPHKTNSNTLGMCEGH